MNKENLVIIAGMPRAGTSYMHQVLGKHPDIFVPTIKETNFFSYNQKKGFDWFQGLYKEAQKDQKYFDISPFYFLDDSFFDNVLAFNKGQKVILLLRDPNEWVKSFYNQLKKQTYNLPKFEDYINGYKLSFENYHLYLNFKQFDFIERVEKFKEKFKNNLLLVDFDFFQRNKVDVLLEIENFIGVNTYFDKNNVPNEKVNAGKVQNNKFITYLSTIDFLRNIAFNILPENIIHYIRNKYILGTPLDSTEHDIYPDIYDKKNIFNEKYFSQSPIVKC